MTSDQTASGGYGEIVGSPEASFFKMNEEHGYVKQNGAKFKVGDRVGVGCLVDSCRTCSPCKSELQQFCESGPSFTYNSTEQDKKTPTQGGYSSGIVVDEKFVLSIPKNLPLDAAAPLLCAGITLYSPLKHWGAGPGKKIAIIGSK